MGKPGFSRLALAATRLTREAYARAAQHDGETRLRREMGAMLQMARSDSMQGDSLDEALREITEVAARGVEVDRAGVWSIDRRAGLMVCLDLYDAQRGVHESGMAIPIASVPGYLAALNGERLVVAHHARVDPRTRELAEVYLAPSGVSSMMDATVRVRGEQVGVICLEHRGPTRRWTLGEQVFASAMTHVVSLAMESHARARAEERALHGDVLGVWLERAVIAARQSCLELDAATEQVAKAIGDPDALGPIRTATAAMRLAIDELDQALRDGPTKDADVEVTELGE